MEHDGYQAADGHVNDGGGFFQQGDDGFHNRIQQPGHQQEEDDPGAVGFDFLVLHRPFCRQKAVDKAAAVQRKDGQHVEGKQYDVDGDAVLGHAVEGFLEGFGDDEAEQAQQQCPAEGHDKVSQGAGNGDGAPSDSGVAEVAADDGDGFGPAEQEGGLHQQQGRGDEDGAD